MIPRKLTESELKELYSGSDKMTIRITCRHCQNEYPVKVNAVAYDNWARKKMPIAEVFPNMKTTDRILLNTHECMNCIIGGAD